MCGLGHASLYWYVARIGINTHIVVAIYFQQDTDNLSYHVICSYYFLKMQWKLSHWGTFAPFAPLYGVIKLFIARKFLEKKLKTVVKV